MTTRNLTVVAAFTALAVVMTWPLTLVMHHEIAWDLGDPVFNTWVLMWTGGQVLRALGGDFNALHDYWDGNIFYPSSLTIAYSEHLTPQMLQILPVFGATGNIVLSYNLLFLSTFVLAGFATYLLVRDLTGRPLAAFLAGLAFAYAPYRVPQFSHVQVLSSFWMPLVVLGFRRFFVTGRVRPLVGGATALALQNLSCGYYLLFFPPFVGAYCLAEMAWRKRLADWRTWRSLAAAALAVALVTWPFVSPYLELRRIRGDVGVRPVEEAVRFSADVHSFATAAGRSTLWGDRIMAWPKDEGEAFPGLAIVIFAAIGVAWGVRRAAREAEPARDQPWQRRALRAIGVLLAAATVLLLVVLVVGVQIGSSGRAWHDTDALFVGIGALVALALALAPAARRFVRGVPDSVFGYVALSAVAAALLALGPVIQSSGQPVGTGPYYWLYTYIPGFDGLRVPARFMMLETLFLAILAGYGAAALLERHAKAGRAIVFAGAVAILAEGSALPMSTNVRVAAEGLRPTPRVLLQGRDVGPLYEAIRTNPDPVVLIEFPFGAVNYEILSTFYAGQHRRPLVNGYSGFFPVDYARRATFLSGIPRDLNAASTAVRAMGATYAMVHEGAFISGRGHEVTEWLTGDGGRIVGRYGTDVLVKLR